MHATLPLKTAGITMLSIIRLSQAWLDAHGWSNAEGASLLEIDQARAVPAGAAAATIQKA
jgi:hypothetical protein